MKTTKVLIMLVIVCFLSACAPPKPPEPYGERIPINKPVVLDAVTPLTN